MKIGIDRVNILLLLFLLLLCVSIFVSSFHPIPAGTGEIGVAARTLEIGDRSFYINDLAPFATVKGYESYQGSFLYPKILEGISFVSIYFFHASTTSFIWNIMLISLCSLLALATGKFLFEIGKLIANERVGLLSMVIYVCCPYTYFYVLSGGITIFVLFGTALVSYILIKIISDSTLMMNFSVASIFHIFCLSLGLVFISCLRPSAILFSTVIIVSAFCFIIINRKIIDNYVYLICLGLLAVVTVISLHQLFLTIDYTKTALDAFVSEPGTFFGYPREVLRENINSLIASEHILSIAQGYLYTVLWKFMDFWSGINDIRDTHSAESFASLFSFFARLSTGFFYFVPLSVIAFLAILLNFRFIISSGLIAPLLASSIAISPSLLGVAMSRYYFMFITPFILLTAILIDQFITFSPQFHNSFGR